MLGQRRIATRQCRVDVILETYFQVILFTAPNTQVVVNRPFLIQVLRGVVQEAVVEQLLRFNRTRLLGSGTHHDGDQTHVTLLGRSHHAITRRVSVARFQAVHARIPIQQQVAVRLTNIVVGELFLSIERGMLGVVVDDMARQDSKVICRRIMVVVRQPRRVHEVGILHAQRLRHTVHQGSKSVFGAGNMFGHRDAGIVTRLNNDPFHQLADRHSGTDAQEHARTTGTPSMLADQHRSLFRQLTLCRAVLGDVGRHQLGQTGRRNTFVRIVFDQHLTRTRVHQQPRGRRQLWRCRYGRRQIERRQVGRQRLLALRDGRCIFRMSQQA